MSQDLDQILLLIGAVLGTGFALLLLLARLEPPRSDASARNVQPSVAEAPAIADLPAGGR